MTGFGSAFLIAFGAIFVAELGDKSQLMAMAFAARFKPLPILVGITIATGRMPRAVELYRGELEIRLPLIYYNGALVHDHAGGADLLALSLPRGALANALEVLVTAPVHPLFFRDEQVYCLEPSLPVRQFCDSEGLRAKSPERLERPGPGYRVTDGAGSSTPAGRVAGGGPPHVQVKPKLSQPGRAC